jgi:hypothetical protein
MVPSSLLVQAMFLVNSSVVLRPVPIEISTDNAAFKRWLHQQLAATADPSQVARDLRSDL